MHLCSCSSSLAYGLISLMNINTDATILNNISANQIKQSVKMSYTIIK